MSVTRWSVQIRDSKPCGDFTRELQRDPVVDLARRGPRIAALQRIRSSSPCKVLSIGFGRWNKIWTSGDVEVGRGRVLWWLSVLSFGPTLEHVTGGRSRRDHVTSELGVPVRNSKKSKLKQRVRHSKARDCMTFSDSCALVLRHFYQNAVSVSPQYNHERE